MIERKYWEYWGTLVKTEGPRYPLKRHVIAWSIFFGGIALCYAVAIYLDYL